MESTQCAKCKSERIVPAARIMDRGHGSMDAGDLNVVTYEDPEALLFKGACKTKLFARVCGECGYTELYAEAPGELYENYRKGSGG